MSHPHAFDLFVIGGGSGGVRAARMAAQRGARVALAEAAALGGTCVNVGCIPKKLYSYAAHYAHDLRDAAGYGWQVGPSHFDWHRLRANRAAEIARLNRIYEKLLADAGVRILRGWASLVDGHTVRLQTTHGSEVFSARHILIATGGTPTVPAVTQAELGVSSDAMFDLEPFPRRLAVVGGGYIACEFASIFRGLGAQVHQLYRGEQILRGFDDEVRAFVAGQLAANGIDLRLHTDVASLQRTAGGIRLQLQDGSRLEADTVLFATGRVPNVSGLGLEAAGVRQGRDGAIEVDVHHRTSVPSIHAVGDVTARVQLTPVALAEAMAVVDRLFGDGRRQMDYDLIPTAVFTQPAIGTVGLGEQQARERYGNIRVFRSDFKALRHTLTDSRERCLVKLVVDAASDRVVGLHMVGPDAGEVVQGFAVAMRAGATKAVFDATIGIHPTVAEEFVTLREAAR
ncbi:MULTISPECIES: glutathione-disulfide reductase [Ramlibacter]|uniref:Glutathione-disulfide reductase n=1 Tax=Ramlibacter pinisoli TaxID=2682844 RepID=A0A6N8ITI7_9BURK|nr:MULTISPECIES: glutathione-disulfide reductase [Ramlibacter]MBA2965295.1 glutathione-disulfide reductase [Ramlibacter sp. CGMCC 1.13660]MVQ30259.1 glutathione-disulfide reductase [Ramlibacter pinisoli]